LILEDPLANSFVASPEKYSENDPQLICEQFQRSVQEDESLGLMDMSSNAKVDAKSIKSDKQTLIEGGKAMIRKKDHPNPQAIQ
jgi:hypothetical protein